MAKRRNAYKILFRNLERKRPLGIPKIGWEIILK
jgi:hypothetical protein